MRAPGVVSFFVSQRTRKPPVSLVNASVCVLPRPDHAPTSFHRTTSRGGFGGGVARHAPAASAAATARTSFIASCLCYRSAFSLSERLVHTLVEAVEDRLAMALGVELQIVGAQLHLLRRLPRPRSTAQVPRVGAAAQRFDAAGRQRDQRFGGALQPRER